MEDRIVSARDKLRKIGPQPYIESNVRPYIESAIDNQRKAAQTQPVTQSPEASPQQQTYEQAKSAKDTNTLLQRMVDALEVQTKILLQQQKGTYYTDPQHRLPFDTGVHTIPVSTPDRPPFDQIHDATHPGPGYVIEPIHDIVGENANRAWITNKGPGILFVIYTSEGIGGSWSAEEAQVDVGNNKVFLNVYEFRLRSPVAGTQYEVSQNEIPLQKLSIVSSENIETFATISSIDFNGQINQFAIETASVQAFQNGYFIRGVTIESEQALDFNLIFFGSAVFNTPNIDIDSFTDNVELDLTQFPSFRINNVNQFFLSQDNLNIVYQDFDNTQQIHMALQNLSPIIKKAGPAGAVRITLYVSPRVVATF